MPDAIHILDVVALTEDLPKKKLYRGHVGTVVESLAPDICEVEFCGGNGRTFATAALHERQLMVLHYRPAETA